MGIHSDSVLIRRNVSGDFGLPDYQEPVHFPPSQVGEPNSLEPGPFPRLPDSVTVSTTDFDSVCPGSNPGRVTQVSNTSAVNAVEVFCIDRGQKSEVTGKEKPRNH